MRFPSKIFFLGSVIALIFGLIAALPLFQSNIDIRPAFDEKPFITFDISYAYVSFLPMTKTSLGSTIATTYHKKFWSTVFSS